MSDANGDRTTDITAQLHAANRRLQQLRQAHKGDAEEKPDPRDVQAQMRQAYLEQRRRQLSSTPSRSYYATAQQPDAAFEPLRQTLETLTQREAKAAAQKVADREFDPATATQRAYPTVLAALLRHELSSAGRVWLLAQYLDSQGRGWIPIETLYSKLCERQSPLRICGRRRLRQLLRQGAGKLWRRDDQSRLWLYGTWRVCRKLGVAKLRGQAVLLPVQTLCDSIGTVRAAFFAAIHAGRRSGPLSRRSLRSISGVAERTQRVYDRRAGVKARSNISVGATATKKNIEQHAARHGRASFVYEDRRGRFGRKGRQYVARRLPNSYTAAYKQAASGRKRKINRRLRQHAATDLVRQVARGNGRGSSRQQSIDRQRRYFAGGRQAVRAAADYQREVHWQASSGGRAVHWHDWSNRKKAAGVGSGHI